MEKLWTTSEVAKFLGINDIDVEQLVQQGKLTGYRLGGQFLRFRPDQVKSLKATMRFRRNTTAAVSMAASWPQQARDFFYFYDFYLVSAGLLAVLIVYLVATG